MIKPMFLVLIDYKLSNLSLLKVCAVALSKLFFSSCKFIYTVSLLKTTFPAKVAEPTQDKEFKILVHPRNDSNLTAKLVSLTLVTLRHRKSTILIM